MPDLSMLARLYHNNNLSETEDEAALAAARSFDPNAKWLKTDSNDGYGFQLDYDPSLAPVNAATGEKGLFGTAPVYADNRDHYLSKDLFKQDENYGEITDARNYRPPQDFLDKYGPMIGPLLISAIAPMAGAAMFGAGIGGGTAAITGGAAGLSAGNIASGGVSSWLTDIARRAPQIARSQSRGFDPLALLSAGGGSTGQGLATLLRLAQGKP